MDLSFVVLTWNSERYIKKCLNSVIDALEKSNFIFEIFIVDNGSHDETVSMINVFQKQYPENIKPILLDHNTGTTYSRNLALKKASGQYIIVMDSDIEIPKGSIEGLISVHQNDSSIGLVVPRLIYPSGNLQKSTDCFPTVFTKLKRFFFLKYIERQEGKEPERGGTRAVEYAISAFWVLKKEAMDNVGLLDENIFYSPEDVDYCLRIWKAGYAVVQNPGVTIVHDAQEISRGLRINKATFLHIKGLLYFFIKHKYLIFRPKCCKNL